MNRGALWNTTTVLLNESWFALAFREVVQAHDPGLLLGVGEARDRFACFDALITPAFKATAANTFIQSIGASVECLAVAVGWA